MIEHDGKPTIASKRSDPLIERALAAGKHLADDVALVLLENDQGVTDEETEGHSPCAGS